MRRFHVLIILISLITLLLPTIPVQAESITGNLHMIGSLGFDKAGFRLEATPSPIALYSVQIKIEEADPTTIPTSDEFYLIRPLNLYMRSASTFQEVAMLSHPVRLCYSFDALDHKRASNLKTWLSMGHFMIGYWDKNNNNWVTLPSRVYWNGEKGLVEAECDQGSCQVALLWSNNDSQLSPVYKEGIRLMVDYQILNPGTDPYIKEGRTMVPLRAIAESLGARVEWNAAEQRIDLVRNMDKVQLWIGKQEAVKNNQSLSIEVAPEITDQRTFVPLRFVSESFGAEVNWDPVTRTAKILK